MDMGPMMHMTFYQTAELTLLVKSLASKEGEAGTYVGLLILVFVMALVLEMLNFLRARLLQKYMDNSSPHFSMFGKISILQRLTVTSVYFFQAILAYSLMLCVMSYNFGVLIILSLGLMTGNFATSYITLRKNINSFNDDHKDALALMERKKSGYRDASGSKVCEAALRRQATIDAHKTGQSDTNLRIDDKGLVSSMTANAPEPPKEMVENP